MEPVELIEAWLAAMRRRDLDTAMSYCAEDVVAHLPGRSALAGDHAGREAVRSAILAVWERVDDEIEVDHVDTLVSADRVALVLRERLGGHELRRVNLYRVRDGKVAEIAVYEGDPEVADIVHGGE